MQNVGEARWFEAAKEHKSTVEGAVATVNKNPVKGLRWLQAEGVVGPLPQEAAQFLHDTPGLDRRMLGELLGHHEDHEVRACVCKKYPQG